MKLIGSFDTRRGTDGLIEYVGAVAKQEGATLTVLTVGVEDTREAILQWIKDTIAMIRDLGREDVQALDKYDRMGVTRPH